MVLKTAMCEALLFCGHTAQQPTERWQACPEVGPGHPGTHTPSSLSAPQDSPTRPRKLRSQQRAPLARGVRSLLTFFCVTNISGDSLVIHIPPPLEEIQDFQPGKREGPREAHVLPVCTHLLGSGGDLRDAGHRCLLLHNWREFCDL